MTIPLQLPPVEVCEWNLLQGLQDIDLNRVRDALYVMALQDPQLTWRYLEQINEVLDRTRPEPGALADVELRR